MMTAIPTAHASEEADARRADQISGQLMSPFCPGKTLDACTSSRAAAWRADIRRWTSEGVASGEIKRRLEERAGRPLSSIPAEDQAKWMPLLTLLLGVSLLGALAFWARRRRAPNGGDEVEATAVADDDARWEARLDDELAALDG
jgi:cytochrome c-type biogenesis protein CcmH/NrfF